MKVIAIMGTFDTKGNEFAFLKKLIEKQGLKTLTIHTGVFEPLFKPDIPNGDISKAAGVDIGEIVAKRDRAYATEVMAKGAEKLLLELYHAKKFDGVISMGGSGGTSLVAKAMQRLPIGVPKVIVSTMAGGNVSNYVGESDIIMIPSIVDVAGINSISEKIYANAAFAITGMVQCINDTVIEKKPLVAATMFGVTTPCLTVAQKYLEERGYEVLVFHATGTGGRTMESLIRAGYIQGVLDITTTEWADQVVGGILAAGEGRLEAAALGSVPQVVSTGAIDMVNFGAFEEVPAKFKGRNLYKHNPSITLMRTTVEENQKIGKKIAEKLNMAKGKTIVILPLKGVSMIDAEGQAFHGVKEDEMLFKTIKETVKNPNVTIIEMDNHINDEVFAQTAAQKLIDLMKNEEK